MFNITELICRVCLQEKEVMINIYDDLEDLDTNLSNLLETCADLQIYENDIFPKYLCDECTRELLITSKFLEKCCKSKEILNEILEKTNVIGNDDLSNSTELIEYCTEDTDDIDPNDLIIQDDALVYEELPRELMDEIEHVEPGIGTSLLKTDIEPLKVSELPKQTAHEYVENILSEDYSNEFHINVDQPIEANPVSDYTVATTNDELMNTIFTKSLSTKSQTINLFKCDVCGALFKQANNLRKHLQKSHGPVDCFCCSKCDHYFSIQTEYYKHVEECSCTSEVGDENIKYKAEKIFSTEYSRKCIYCERDFATPFALRMHLRTHTGERPFQCKYCTKSFKTQSQLNVHHKRHTGQADFICTFCNKSFYEQSNLTAHLRSHTGERPHICTICNKTFARVFLLQFHMRTHTGEKPFKCNYCDKSFRQDTDLRSHLTIHTGEKRHTCILCGKSYIKRSHLVQHMRKHPIHTNSTEEVTAAEPQEHSAAEINSAACSIKYDVQNPENIYSFNEIENENGDVVHSDKFL